MILFLWTRRCHGDERVPVSDHQQDHEVPAQFSQTPPKSEEQEQSADVARPQKDQRTQPKVRVCFIVDVHDRRAAFAMRMNHFG